MDGDERELSAPAALFIHARVKPVCTDDPPMVDPCSLVVGCAREACGMSVTGSVSPSSGK